MTPYHCQYWANLLTLKVAGGSIENLTRSIPNSRRYHRLNAPRNGLIRRYAGIDDRVVCDAIEHHLPKRRSRRT